MLVAQQYNTGVGGKGGRKGLGRAVLSYVPMAPRAATQQRLGNCDIQYTL